MLVGRATKRPAHVWQLPRMRHGNARMRTKIRATSEFLFLHKNISDLDIYTYQESVLNS